MRGLKDGGRRWNEWTELVQSCCMPYFTEVGFKVVEAPLKLSRALQEHYREQLFHATAEQDMRPSRWGLQTPDDSDEHVPLWIDQAALNAQVHQEMKPLLEEWSGVELSMGQVYGLRVYTNGSTLMNHIDKPDTHVISFIFHVGHDTDEPWPLEIEDHNGRIHGLTLEPGQVVYYESAKQYHARMTPMRGRHYASVFGHYMPKHNWNWTRWDLTVAVPPQFSNRVPPDAEQAQLVADAPPLPLDVYVEDYWSSRGMAVPEYPHDQDERAIHVFADISTERDDL